MAPRIAAFTSLFFYVAGARPVFAADLKTLSECKPYSESKVIQDLDNAIAAVRKLNQDASTNIDHAVGLGGGGTKPDSGQKSAFCKQAKTSYDGAYAIERPGGPNLWDKIKTATTSLDGLQFPDRKCSERLQAEQKSIKYEEYTLAKRFRGDCLNSLGMF
jgi:hypothetical protein